MNLSTSHLADLRRSGLCDEQIEACGFWSEASSSRIAELLGWPYPPAAPWPCLAIPYRLADGAPAAYCRLRPDSPRLLSGGKPVRYESPLGRGTLVFFPPGFVRNRAAGKELLVVEGEKKAAAADQYGYACVGLAGVYGWQSPRPGGEQGKGERQVLPSLCGVLRDPPRVYVAFDSDAATNPAVSRARSLLCVALLRLGLCVRVCRLDPDPGGNKQGVDDVLAAGGELALRHLLRWAEPATMPAWAESPRAPEPVNSSHEDYP